jgi:hypothetical protein
MGCEKLVKVGARILRHGRDRTTENRSNVT